MPSNVWAITVQKATNNLQQERSWPSPSRLMCQKQLQGLGFVVSHAQPQREPPPAASLGKQTVMDWDLCSSWLICFISVAGTKNFALVHQQKILFSATYCAGTAIPMHQWDHAALRAGSAHPGPILPLNGELDPRASEKPFPPKCRSSGRHHHQVTSCGSEHQSAGLLPLTCGLCHLQKGSFQTNTWTFSFSHL